MPFNFKTYQTLGVCISIMAMTGCIGDFKQIEINVCPLEEVHPNNLLDDGKYNEI